MLYVCTKQIFAFIKSRFINDFTEWTRLRWSIAFLRLLALCSAFLAAVLSVLIYHDIRAHGDNFRMAGKGFRLAYQGPAIGVSHFGCSTYFVLIIMLMFWRV